MAFFRYPDELILDTFRFILGFSILSIASYTDIKMRRAPNVLWIIMGLAGLIILIVQYWIDGLQEWTYLLFIPIFMVLIYLLFYVGLIFGGADAKALMALSILAPFWPSLIKPLPSFSMMPFPWVIFTNSIILFLLIPPALFIYNAVKGEIELPYALLGYRMEIEKAKEKFVWPLEKFDGNRRRLVIMPKEFDATEQLNELEKRGLKKVWVTPKIPFMIPLLIGFVISFFYGDILFAAINFMLRNPF